MVHQPVMVKISDKQMSKLRNGHKVRVKPPDIEGNGICLIVHPENYNIISKSFSKNKGAEIALKPEELAINKEAAPTMEGQGIFGKKYVGKGILGKQFDRAVKKAVGKKATKQIYGVARQFLPVAQAGLSTGLMSGATALSAVQPELAPFLMPAAANLSKIGSSYLDNPNTYQKHPELIAADFGKNLLMQQLNAQTGQKLGANKNAQTANANANLMSAANANKMGQARLTGSGVNKGIRYVNSTGNPLYGYGLHSQHSRHSAGQVGLNGGMIHHLPPALQSQPFSAKFNSQLPPAYQKFVKSGSGLYV